MNMQLVTSDRLKAVLPTLRSTTHPENRPEPGDIIVVPHKLQPMQTGISNPNLVVVEYLVFWS